jgi:hypothetical protein
MAVVQLHCPLCQGAFQVDDSAAGQNVNCPLCQGVVTIPAFDPAGRGVGFGPPVEHAMYPPGFAPGASTFAPAPSFGLPPSAGGPEHSLLPPSAPEPLTSAALQLSCPICAGVFEVTPDMAGLHLACPHCQSAVTIPALWGNMVPPAPSAEPVPYVPPISPRESAQQNRPEAPLQNFYPPGMEPQGRREEPASAGEEQPIRAPVQQLYPPGFEPAEAKRPAPSFEPPRERKPAAEERPAPRSKSGEAQPPPSITRRAGGTIESLLPPGAAPSAEALLPPGPGGPLGAAGLLPPSVSPGQVESMLPPGAAPANAPVPVQQVPLPVPQPALPVGTKAAKKPARTTGEKILIPTEEGGYVTVREPVKTVGVGEKEVELKVLTPAEKAKRRLIRSAIVGGFCLIVLFVTMVLLYWRG